MSTVFQHSGSDASPALRTSSVMDGGEELKLNYQKPGKKATTILSPHLDTIDYGNIIIVLDNSQTSLNIDEPITGKIKVNLTKEFDASAITLNLCGYQRSHFTPPAESSNF